jgi:plastocyanin
MALANVGCGKEGRETHAPSGSVNISASTTKIDLALSGSIKGFVRLDGAPPVFRAIDMSAAPACVKANNSPVIPPQVVTSDDGALADVAIYIKSGLGNFLFDAPKDPVILEQKACMYEPHVIALMVNQKLEVLNDDSTTHNVHVLAKSNPSWNKSQTIDAPAIEQLFSHPELAIPIVCNVHPWMRAYAFVFENPYYAVSSTTGTFELKNLPPGTYTVEAWQERYGTLDQTVTIGPKESKTISFRFKSVNPAGGGAPVSADKPY